MRKSIFKKKIKVLYSQTQTFISSVFIYSITFFLIHKSKTKNYSVSQKWRGSSETFFINQKLFMPYQPPHSSLSDFIKTVLDTHFLLLLHVWFFYLWSEFTMRWHSFFFFFDKKLWNLFQFLQFGVSHKSDGFK